ncbi:N-6 DNA methylase [Sphaerisporangium sp. NPDC051011]|uniref:N-6 DNA methylase n=1 Tax=Sphaerisporangium sp. NPDC051011 TaxID=3155792 RepID=UPI0034057EC3
MAKPPRTQGQLDLFAQHVLPAQGTLPAPTPATTTRVSPLATAAKATPPQPTVSALADGDRRTRTLRKSASDIAEIAAETWHRQHAVAGDGIAIAMGIVAGLTLLRKTSRDGVDTATFLLDLDPPTLLEFHRRIWAYTWIRHPYLIDCARAIHDWLNEDTDPPAKIVSAVHAVTHAVIRAGLLDITGDPDPALRCDADVLGLFLTRLRSQGAGAALAEIHTPPDVANLLTSILNAAAKLTIEPGQPKPGGWLDEPAAGTGGMFRAAAMVMREQGTNPHDFGWSMTDLDPIAAAACAVNALVWDLGPSVLVWCGDTLAEGDGPARAWERRKAVLEHHDHMMSIASMTAAVRQTQILLSRFEREVA